MIKQIKTHPNGCVFSIFLDDHKAVHQIGADQLTFDGNAALHQVRQNDAAILAADGHDIFHDDVLVGFFVFIDGGKTHKNLQYCVIANGGPYLSF